MQIFNNESYLSLVIEPGIILLHLSFTNQLLFPRFFLGIRGSVSLFFINIKITITCCFLLSFTACSKKRQQIEKRTQEQHRNRKCSVIRIWTYSFLYVGRFPINIRYLKLKFSLERLSKCRVGGVRYCIIAIIFRC